MSLIIADRNKNLELKKHVNAIHCTNNLTLVQRKLVNALLFNAYPELPHKNRFKISAKNLCNLIGYNSNDYGKLKKALLGLITIAIEWNVIDCVTGAEKQWKASSILSSAELSNGVCLYEYSQVMKELLYQPEIYGRIDMIAMSQFKSSYGLALYENCIRFQGLPQTPWYTLEVFRKLMGVFGNKYSSFKDFKKRVINIAVDEVNRLAKIDISVEIERQNQKVTRLRFKLNKKRAAQIKNLDEIDNGTETKDILVNTFNLSNQLINDIFNEYEPDYIREKVDLIMSSDSFIEGKIRGLSGYLVSSLKKDFKPSKSSKVIVDEIRAKKEKKETEEANIKNKQKIKYDKYIANKVNKYLESVSEDSASELESLFSNKIKKESKIIYKWYKKDGFDHQGVKACFNDFIKGRIDNIISFEDFLSLINDF